jgi:trehalose-6-phosphate synthase
MRLLSVRLIASLIVGITVLHDRINLVAKEFLAARRDERGVLILR